MRLKRLVIGALVAGSLLGSAVGVGAAAPQDGNANCIAIASNLNAVGKEFLGANGFGGQVISDAAQRNGGVGQFASRNCAP